MLAARIVKMMVCTNFTVLLCTYYGHKTIGYLIVDTIPFVVPGVVVFIGTAIVLVSTFTTVSL